MQELWALLHFIEPLKFPSEAEFIQQFGEIKEVKIQKNNNNNNN